MIERLNALNDLVVYSVSDPVFQTYGKVINGYDFSDLIAYMETETVIPKEGNVYLASVPGLEKHAVKDALQDGCYGQMPIQIGYCNGRNSTYNGFEYHKGSEITVAVTDFMLVLGHSWEIRDNTYQVSDAKVFYVPKDTVIELYQTTLHLSPCRVCDEGFKAIIILPEGTNTPLSKVPEPKEPEGELLLLKNKWVIAHAEREPLVKQGAHVGLIGPNKELKY